jgi:hypothetical protein
MFKIKYVSVLEQVLLGGWYQWKGEEMEEGCKRVDIL